MEGVGHELHHVVRFPVEVVEGERRSRRSARHSASRPSAGSRCRLAARPRSCASRPSRARHRGLLQIVAAREPPDIADMRAARLVAQRRRQHAPGGQDGSEIRHDHAGHLEQTRHAAGMQPGRAAEAQQREVARIDALRHGREPDPSAILTLMISTMPSAMRSRESPSSCRERDRGRLGRCAVELAAAGERTLGIEPAEHEIGVRHGGLGAASPHRRRGRAGRRRFAGRHRARREAPRAIEPPPAPMLMMSRLRSAIRWPARPRDGGERRLSLDDQRDVGARPSHVEGDEVRRAEDLARPACSRRRRRRAPTARSRPRAFVPRRSARHRHAKG